MSKGKRASAAYWRQVLFVLTLSTTVLLTACGNDPSPTFTATTLPNTTIAATTVVATTVPVTLTTPASTTAPTTAVAATTANAITTTTTPDGASNSAVIQELFGLIPDNPDNLKWLVFNDYAGLRKLYGLATVSSLTDYAKQKGNMSVLMSATNYTVPSRLFATDRALEELPTLIGYDLFQIDYDAGAGLLPVDLNIAKGRFNYKAISTAFSATKFTQSQIGNYTAFSNEKLDLNNPIQRYFISTFNNLVLLENKNLLISSGQASNGPSKTVQAVVEAADGKKSFNSVKDNPAVKALLETFGNPLTLFFSNQFASAGVSPGLTPEQVARLQEQLKILPKNPVLGGYAYYEDKPGERSYLLANYYPNAEDAKKALPVLEDILRNGASLTSKQPYSQIFEVVSTENKGNLALFKLKLKGLTPLSQLVFQRDLPTFWL